MFEREQLEEDESKPKELKKRPKKDKEAEAEERKKNFVEKLKSKKLVIEYDPVDRLDRPYK